MEKEQACEAEKRTTRRPWNKGKLIGAKPPLRPSHVWSIRTKLQMQGKPRDLALFNLAIDSGFSLLPIEPINTKTPSAMTSSQMGAGFVGMFSSALP